MRLRTIKILVLFYCLYSSALLSGQVYSKPETLPAVKADSVIVAEEISKYITGMQLPDISGPAEIHLDRQQALRFLRKIYSSAGIWKHSNDPLRESIRHLIYFSSTPPVDSTLSFLEGYCFERIRVPIENYYVFDSVRIILPEKAIDTIVLVITDTIPEPSLNSGYFPFRYLEYPYMSDSLEAAVGSLIGYLEARDSTLLRITDQSGNGPDLWLNTRTDNLVRFWLPDGKGDSVTVWIGSPQRNTLSLRAEEGVQFKRQTWQYGYIDPQVNVTTAREEDLRKIALSNIKPRYWKFRSELSYLLSQGVVTNWAKGGDDNIASILDVTSYLNYNNKITKVNSATTVRFALGLQASGKPWDLNKNLDFLEINSKIGHKAFGKFDLSGLFQFKTQFLPGYNYPNDSVKVSKFFNPATVIVGYGLDYKPDKNTSISFSPFSYKGTFVPDTANINQTKFGISSDRRSKNELGAYLIVSSKVSLFEKVNMTNKLQLFSNFLSKPQNVDVDWEMITTMNINWFTELRLNIHLIYDDDTKLPVYDSENKPVIEINGIQKKAPMVQFKEYLGLSFVFKF
ncbi:MAG TPA: DUF3078 domain-containing protein [Bacteroidales bacterium]|nr:DUF3078 domain-containing protein [Bacteroidales bacterium]